MCMVSIKEIKFEDHRTSFVCPFLTLLRYYVELSSSAFRMPGDVLIARNRSASVVIVPETISRQ